MLRYKAQCRDTTHNREHIAAAPTNTDFPPHLPSSPQPTIQLSLRYGRAPPSAAWSCWCRRWYADPDAEADPSSRTRSLLWLPKYAHLTNPTDKSLMRRYTDTDFWFYDTCTKGRLIRCCGCAEKGVRGAGNAVHLSRVFGG